jgi:hypothetical protein
MIQDESQVAAGNEGSEDSLIRALVDRPCLGVPRYLMQASSFQGPNAACEEQSILIQDPREAPGTPTVVSSRVGSMTRRPLLDW